MKHKGDIVLDGLITLSESSAAAIAFCHSSQKVFLRGIRVLSYDAARSLANARPIVVLPRHLNTHLDNVNGGDPRKVSKETYDAHGTWYAIMHQDENRVVEMLLDQCGCTDYFSAVHPSEGPSFIDEVIRNCGSAKVEITKSDHPSEDGKIWYTVKTNNAKRLTRELRALV